MINSYSDPGLFIRRQIFSELSGMSIAVTPSGCKAFNTALTMAPGAPQAPPSPIPFTPEGDVEFARKLHVVGELTLARDQARVFLTGHRLSNAEFHGISRR